MTSDPAYRFACASFAFCLIVLSVLLVLWLVVPVEMSVHDFGSPQLRAWA